eukprot:TRINITY_DN2127_c0_g1_i1.p1 TRINITY_DN2127_c0_g1~~TRINITY_DN2127_c0_g1_i1.p1  ORF type:complete len:275 (-),score=37.78 TRINITY_DN2127_c0_g1_i1:87-911(-)
MIPAAEARFAFQRKRIVSSRTLQQLLYFNAFFSFTYFIVEIFVLRYKSLNVNDIRADLVNIVVFSLWALIEFLRIYNGWVGNLQEGVHQLSSSLLLIVFPQFFLLLYLAFFQKPLYPFDHIIAAILFIFMVLEIIFEIVSIRAIIQDKRARLPVDFAAEMHANQNAQAPSQDEPDAVSSEEEKEGAPLAHRPAAGHRFTNMGEESKDNEEENVDDPRTVSSERDEQKPLTPPHPLKPSRGTVRRDIGRRGLNNDSLRTSFQTPQRLPPKENKLD